MTWIKSVSVSLIVLLSWTAIALVAWPWHHGIFGLVPPDGLLSTEERQQYDRVISQYLIRGDGEQLRVFHKEEVEHLADVRGLWIGIVLISLLGVSQLRRLAEPEVMQRAAWMTLGIGLVTLISFPLSFTALHLAFFADGTWQFDPTSFLLTRMYPLPFFVWMWSSIVGLAFLTLILWNRRMGTR